MSRKIESKQTKRGKFVHSSNPARAIVVGLPHVEAQATPIGKKKALELTQGIPLPTARGILTPTVDGRSIIARKITKGAITYSFCVV